MDAGRRITALTSGTALFAPTTNACGWTDPHYVPERDGYSYMHEGRKGEGVRPILDQQLTLNTKKTCDLEYQKRGMDFIERSVAKATSRSICYFNHSLMHFPMIPRDEFVGARAPTAIGATAC